MWCQTTPTFDDDDDDDDNDNDDDDDDQDQDKDSDDNADDTKAQPFSRNTNQTSQFSFCFQTDGLLFSGAISSFDFGTYFFVPGSVHSSVGHLFAGIEKKRVWPFGAKKSPEASSQI